MSFNHYYQSELTALRQLGRRFAERSPALAPFLGQAGRDPDVERLLEGFAFLTGRLRQKLEAVLAAADIDESRIIAEAAIYADHVAVDEETVRLRSHIAQLRQMLESGSPVGRKADFLIQEFNREANTIGSKCQNADIAKVVVDLKSEIEKIREQIQNIE